MSLIEKKLLSKVLEERNGYVLNKHNVQENDFYSLKEAYKFINEYIRQYGETPDYRTVVAEYKDFDYMPEVFDTFPYLCKSLKANTAKRQAYELLQKQAGQKFETLNGTEFINWLAEESVRIKDVANASSSTGTNYATNGQERREWYEESKEIRTGQYIPTPYPSLTEWLGGGFEIGDYILLQAYTNRGKSWIGSQIAVEAWRNNFGVLHYSPELSKSQQIFRLDTLNGHFNNVAIRRGTLNNEEEYFKYLGEFKAENEKFPYIVKCMEDLPQGLTVGVIESDLQANPNVKMVIIDGFNLMTHKGTDGNRNNMANTSRMLRQIFGRHKVAGLVIHQTPTSAEKENRAEDETGVRIVTPPRIDQYSETIAVIQDASTVLTFDQHDGVGALLLAKCREPHVGKQLEMHCDFNRGYILESRATSKAVGEVEYF
ncbi:MAG: replicative helicase [Clostridia bacterium]|jgi:replicative DNA helicase|nr:replicative helicase [Clostridia bacterium]